MSAYGHVPDPDIFRFLLAACVRKRPVDVTYRSKTRTFITRFSPHTLVRTAHRMHFRGYSIIGDGRPGFYWDLVPARALSVTEAPRDDYVDLSGDIEWYEYASASLVLSDGLPEELRNAVRREHGLDGAVLTLGPMPRALLRYAIGTHTDRRYDGWQAAVWLDPGALV
jgi:hypothetical protein